MTDHSENLQGIAVVGLAGRFPGADDLGRFWRNLREGVEAITFFTDEELLAEGVPVDRLRDPSYVRARGALSGVELFDAGFFDYSPREAEVMDPQHRLFLECAWEALENAGYAGDRYDGAIGVYAGASANTYLVRNLAGQPGGRDALRGLAAMIGGAADYLTTRVSYKLNLRGPSIVVQTACSTSLVAVHLACQGLLDYHCDLALAGGVSVRLPQVSGYSWQDGGILSPDGHCRAFDARARGTVGGNGVGIVVLKRLEEALADGDTIHAVILGTAANNDGAAKVSYSAPSVEGQANAIALAQALAGVEPASITYVEAHGTGTALGDPIEVAALSRVFRVSTDRKAFCALGSVKTNIGHLDAAAGIAGLIKTIMALQHRQIPPSLHFERPNPEIPLAESPFYVNARLASWETGGRLRRAGVSSFGIGGTNAHAVLEEAPPSEPAAPSRPWQLLVVSAKTPTALHAATERLAGHLAEHPEQSLADVAHTLRVGRRSFSYRRALVCRDAEEARSLLAERDPRRLLGAHADALDPPVAFLLPGLGDQYVGMGLGLYRHERVFRETIDLCAELLEPALGIDLRDLIYPRDLLEGEGRHGLDLRSLLGRGGRQGEARFERTDRVQPALFAVEYALAKLLASWGVRPRGLLGYSLGEYVAACLAGVFSLEDALFVVTERARMIQDLPAGAMLAVPFGEPKVVELLGRRLSLAAVNAPELSVVAGPVDDVDALERDLTARGLACRRLQATHAFHSWMMEPLRGRLAELVGRVRRSPPSVPYLSNLTGRWISAAEATDPSYWAEHLCRTVRFEDGITELWRASSPVLLEVGPGQSLCSLALQQAAGAADTERIALPSLRSVFESQPDQAYLLGALGRLWVSGVSPDWGAFAAGERRRRVPLPTYPFDRQRYWIEPYRGPVERAATDGTRTPGGQVDVTRPATLADDNGSGSRWLVLMDRQGSGARLVEHLRKAGRQVTAAEIDPHRPDDGDTLLAGFDDARVVDLRPLDTPGGEPSHGMLALVQTLVRLTGELVGDEVAVERSRTAEVAPATSEAGRQRRGHARPHLWNPYVAPLDELERGMAGLWEALLGIEQIGRHDSFFELGGHSLLGTQLLSRARDLFGIQLSLADLFEAPSIEALSGRVKQAREADRLSRTPPLVPVPRRSEVPLSFSQQRLWFLDQLAPGSPAYNLPIRMRLRGELDIGTLRRSLREVVRRHEVLRTRFVAIGGRPSQAISPVEDLPMSVIDLSVPAERGAEPQRIASHELQRPFRLDRGPLLRAVLLRLDVREHVLLLTIHHIVSDGWSNALLIQEMAEAYASLLERRPPRLPDLPIQYADYAEWQQRWIGSGDFEAQLTYWRERLADAPAVLELPTDRPRPPQVTFHGASVRFALSRAVANGIEALARQRGATPFMVLLAAFELLLGRYSGRDDVLIGTPIANRTRSVLESLIGFFANTLVLRNDLARSSTFLELLESVREAAVGAYEHQEMPFERLVEELQPERNLAYPPVFQVVFVLQNTPVSPPRLPGLTLSPFKVENTAAKFDWTLSLFTDAEGIGGWLEYNTDLFDGATTHRAIAHFENLLREALASPDGNILDLPLLAESEFAQLVTEWSGAIGAGDWSFEQPAHHQLAAQAARRPHALALTTGSERITYGELDRSADRLAHHLCRLGVGPEVPVGIFLERSPMAIIAIVATLKAGGGYVPLDPSYPPERLAFLLEDCGVRVVLTDGRLAAQLPSCRAQVIDLDREREAIERCTATGAPRIGLLPDNLAYQIYTSGSTGVPKGVQVSHRSLAHLTRAFAEALDLGGDDRLLMIPSLSFDASVGDIFPALTSGAALVLHPSPSDLSGRELLALCDEQEVTVVDIPAVFWQQWLDELIGGLPVPARLRLVIAGGESIDRERVRAWQRATAGRVAFFGAYGPTEATVCTTFAKIGGDREVPAGSGRVPIGRPVAGARVLLLDRHLRPVPAGVPGELYIGGEGVARGYRDRPAPTADRFSPCPFGGLAGGRLYRTGDLARFLSDGNLEFLGRVDDQVKIRGYRVELGEIEAALARHPGVREAVVMAREDNPGHRRLVAYVTAAAGAEGQLTPAALRSGLQKTLPDYMVPTAFTVLSALPVTPNGKLDRRALPPPESTPRTVGFAAPRTPAELTMAEIWRQVLRVDTVGIHDNFFDLGGDSILSIQIVARANEANLHLAPRHLFQHQTVAELAEVAVVIDDTSSGDPPAEPRRTKTVFPLARLSSGELRELGAMLDQLDER